MSEGQSQDRDPRSHEVITRAEIPRGQDRIYFNQGHTPDLVKSGIVGPDSLYYVSGKKSPFSSVSLSELLKNPILTENRLVVSPGEPLKNERGERIPAQNVFYSALYQELGQTNVMVSLVNLKKDVQDYENNPASGKYIEAVLTEL